MSEEVLTLGTILDGRYLIERELGRGGVGVVYLARDGQLLMRPVVVKVLLEESLQNEWVVRKFKQEMEALVRVEHSGIVGIFDAGITPAGAPYIVMQYVAGANLRSAINDGGMDLERTAQIFRQMGRALDAAHAAGVIHRDLKPENIMLQRVDEGEELVKIVDFGIAKVVDSVVAPSTVTLMSAGTILYMSPEQLTAKPVSVASDVYALGVIAYELVTGRRPFNPDSIFQLLELQRIGVPVRPKDLRPALPAEAQTAILKALAYEPQARYQRARTFCEALADAIDGSLKAATLPNTDNTPAAPTARSEMLLGHVLFMDVVGYSKLPIDRQTQMLARLQAIVQGTAEYKRAQAGHQLVSLPTGDGMALVFFTDPEAPVRCALEVGTALKDNAEIKLRSGINSGPVEQLLDVNGRENVAGAGINMAQRVMDCGDAGHILLSERVADDLNQWSRWQGALHDLGETKVKHDVRLHVFNLYKDGLGNLALPQKFKQARTSLKKLAVGLGALMLIGLAAFALWQLVSVNSSRRQLSAVAPPVSAPEPERDLSYSLTVQRPNGGPDSNRSLEFTGHEPFGNGAKFRLNIFSAEQGALYLFNEGAGADGTSTYNVLFPTPKNNNGSALLSANQTIQTGWYIFDNHPGTEKLWLIWAAAPIEQLDALFKDSFSHKLTINRPEQFDAVRALLAKHRLPEPEVTIDHAQKRATLKGRSSVLISLLNLEHK